MVVRVHDWKCLAKGTFPKVECSDGSDDIAAIVLSDGTLKLVDLLETSYGEKNTTIRTLSDCKWSTLLDSKSNLVSVRLQNAFLCASYDDKCLRTWPLSQLFALNSQEPKKKTK